MESDALLSFASEKGQSREYIDRPKIVRARYEVSRWSVLLSTFSMGVIVGAVIASPDKRLRTSENLSSPMAAMPVVSKPVAADPPDERPTTGAFPSKAGHAALARPTSVSAPLPPPPLPTRRASGYRGTLIVNSQPGGASVFVNGRLAGQTPLVINALPIGSRAVRLSLDGYGPWSSGVNVVANQSTTVSAKLARDD